jgi:hypothetical protein
MREEDDNGAGSDENDEFFGLARVDHDVDVANEV